VDTGMTSRVLNDHTRSVTSVAFSPDSRYLASTSVDKSVRIRDLVTGMTSCVPDGHTSSVGSVALSPNNRYLASCSDDKSVRIWDVDAGMTSRVLNGHTDGVKVIAFSPDNRYLASASNDNSVRIWDLVTWASVSRKFTTLRDLCFSSDGAHVAVSLFETTQYLDTLTLQDANPLNPRLYEPSTSLEPFPSIRLKDQSLCVQRGDTTMYICWLPSYITASTPVVQSGNIVGLGAHGGEVIMVDLSHFRLPEVVW